MSVGERKPSDSGRSSDAGGLCAAAQRVCRHQTHPEDRKRKEHKDTPHNRLKPRSRAELRTPRGTRAARLRGRPLEAFAIPTMLGELRRYFRDSSWVVHVAGGAQERSKAVQDAIELLSRDYGSSPTVQQLALYLELSDEEIVDALQVANAYTASSLDAPVQNGEEEDEATLGSTLGETDSGYQHVETDMLIEGALAGLTDREQRRLELRFVDELTQAQIGKQLGISQMQVSRLLLATLGERIDEPATA